MTDSTELGGTYRLADDLELTRMGYGAMQLAGKGVFGPPADPNAAIAVLRAVVELGITHIDTSDYYGPRVTNELIHEALHPYPENLHLVTKVGAERDEEGGWPNARSPQQLREQVEGNLERLGIDAMDLVNLRLGGFDAPEDGSLAEPFGAMVDMQREGLIKHIGLSNVNAEQVAEARAVAPIVCVQNMFNIAQRRDDDLIEQLAADGIAYVPFFPLGGFSRVQSDELDAVASELGTTAMTVALAWLLQHSPNILLIPGTSSVDHLHDNVAAASLELPPDVVARLDAIGAN